MSQDYFFYKGCFIRIPWEDYKDVFKHASISAWQRSKLKEKLSQNIFKHANKMNVVEVTAVDKTS